jgi:hypothetical protein
MKPETSTSVRVGLWVTALVGLAACDTGFGQPCKLPKSPTFQNACNTTVSEDQPDAGATDPRLASKASCAVNNYAGCETRTCLVYRGSSPFCSEPCTSNSECEGESLCCPILGGCADNANDTACQADPETGFQPECYCVRKVDTDN